MHEGWETREREDLYPYGRPFKKVFTRMAGIADRSTR
jgi:hypothetical protein